MKRKTYSAPGLARTSELTSWRACARLQLFQRQPPIWSQCSWRLFEQSRWRMLITWACLLACLLAFVCVCAFDAAMSLLLSCLGAATRADLGQTLRVSVTFKNNLPLSRKDRQCICHFLRLSIPFALCKPSMQLSPKGKKIKIYMCQHTYLYLYFSL